MGGRTGRTTEEPVNRLLVVAVVCILALPNPALACPGSRYNQKPFNPTVGVKFHVADEIYTQNPLLGECVRQGLELWHSPADQTPVVSVPVSEADVYVYFVSPESLGAQQYPNARWANQSKDPAGFTIGGAIQIPWNIMATAGFEEEGGCSRIMKVAAHELGHGFFGDGNVHQWGSIMQQSNNFDMWGGLDYLPLGPTYCDRQNEKFARTYEDGSGTQGGGDLADAVEPCNESSYTDSHGCPCGAFLMSIPNPYTGYNHKPFGHIEWPKAGVYAPFSGNLQMHATDVDGWVNRVDYSINGSPLLTTTTPDFGFPFSVTPGSYSIGVVLYDTADEYTILPPVQVNVCGGPPPQVGLPSYIISGSTVYFWWTNPSPDWTTLFQFEAGTYPGGTDAGLWHVAPAPTTVYHTVLGVPSGTYYVRVRAYNPCGFGAPSYETTVVVP